MAIVLNDITSGYNLAKINANFQNIEDYINDKLLARADTGVAGEAMMERALDMNGNKILNVFVDVNDANSLLTVGAADSRYYNVSGDTLTGPMDANSQIINNLPSPTLPSQPATKAYADAIQQDVNYNESRSLRFPDNVDEMSGVVGRANSLQGYNDVGKPVSIFAMTSTADLALKLASSGSGLGAGLVGYDIASTYSNNTVGNKLNLMLTPWDFGAVADGTLHPLSEYYATLAAAQAVYPFVTSLTQSIDYAAIQKCVNTMITRGAAGMSMGGRGRFCINDTILLNKTGSVNDANKTVDFSGALIETYGGNIILNDTSFTSWTLTGGVTVSSGTLVFNGTTSTQANAAITLTGLTVGKRYAVSVVTESYTSKGYLRIRMGTTAISRPNEYGPGVRHAEFTATATSQVLNLVDDTYTITPTQCVVKEVDVREATYAFNVYQTGTSITHGSVVFNNFRVYNRSSSCFAGLRTENLNHAVFDGITSFVGFYGMGWHPNNTSTWSENITVNVLLGANCREVVRFSRPVAGTGLNSFARTNIKRIVFSGCRYAMATEAGTAVYDSVIGSINGNLTSNFRAVLLLHGDQTDSVVESIRVENNSAPSTAGVFEYGRNDLRRINVRNVGSYTNINLLATGSLSAGTVSLENAISGTDFRPASPYFGLTTHLPQSGKLGTGLTYIAGTYTWSEILLDCTPSTGYVVGTPYNLVPAHGIVDLDLALRNADGTSYQGTKTAIKMLKGTVATADANKVVVYNSTHTISSEEITVTWPGSTAPTVSHNAETNRSIQVYARWTL